MTQPPVHSSAGGSGSRGVDRRTVLRTALLAGGATAALAALPADARATTPAPLGFAEPPPAPATGGLQLFADPNLDFQVRFAFGAAGYGAAEFGEVVTFVNQANEAGGDYQAFVDACSAMATQVASNARRAERERHRVTAAACYLRAAEYLAQSLYFVLGTSTPAAEPEVYATMRSAWDSFCELSVPSIKQVRIPYGGSSIPGYLLTPGPTSTPRPTVILNNGSDAQSVELWGYGGAAAIERGYNALIFEGPGQGATLFEREIPFRPDWEKVITPVVDFLEAQEEVDADKLALVGWSMGGELVIRAAAFEPRLRAVVADPGAVSIWDAWPQDAHEVADAGTPREVNALWAEAIATFTPAQSFNIRKRSEIFGKQFLRQARAGQMPTDFAALSTEMKRYDARNVAHRLEMPVLITSYEGDTFFAGQPEELFGLLRAPKEIVDFTAADGAQLHCAPMAPQHRNEVIFDWLDDVMR
jgi:pimeloyl-ACP methyl ester carboxylesterase